jgi:hypothetical protein
MNLDRERDAIIHICIEAAETQERMLKMFPQNIQYKEFAQMARWVAAEVERRKGRVFDGDGAEVEGDALAALNKELLVCQEENLSLKGLLVGLRVERDRLKSCVLAHEENTARIVAEHDKSIDAHTEKDDLIRQLRDRHDSMSAHLDASHDAMETERKAVRDHERQLIAEGLRKMAERSPDVVEDKVLKIAAAKVLEGWK